MKRNYIIAFAVTAAVLALLAFAALALFEIEPRTKWVPPSREALRNKYLALDRWLLSRGISVREESYGNFSTISSAAEKNIFMQASLFHWKEEAPEQLTRWIEEGGHLYLVLDYKLLPAGSHTQLEEEWVYHDEEPFLLLEEFGISAGRGTGLPGKTYSSDAPYFDEGITFELTDEASQEAGSFVIKGRTGLTKLVQVKRGKGKLSVSGPPVFLLSVSLEEEPNARLALVLFGEGGAAASKEAPAAVSAENAGGNSTGWLFIRGTTKTQGLFGSLWRQGNLLVLLISILVLLAACFWAVIPLFGIVKEDSRISGEKPGKPLRERFLAEGRFFKRYGALNVYREVYIKEIKRKLARKEGLVDNEKTEKRLLEICGAQTKEGLLLIRILRGDHFPRREFPKIVTVLNYILERI